MVVFLVLYFSYLHFLIRLQVNSSVLSPKPCAINSDNFISNSKSYRKNTSLNQHHFGIKSMKLRAEIPHSSQIIIIHRKRVKEFRTTKYFLLSLKHKFGKLKHEKNKKSR